MSALLSDDPEPEVLSSCTQAATGDGSAGVSLMIGATREMTTAATREAERRAGETDGEAELEGDPPQPES